MCTMQIQSYTVEPHKFLLFQKLSGRLVAEKNFFVLFHYIVVGVCCYIIDLGILEQKHASLKTSGRRPSSVLFRYRLNRYHDGRRTAPPGTALRLVLHRLHQYVRVPYCSKHVLVESLLIVSCQHCESVSGVIKCPLLRFVFLTSDHLAAIDRSMLEGLASSKLESQT